MAILPPDPVFVLKGKSPVHSIAFQKGWDRLLCGGLDGNVQIWSLQSNRNETTISVGKEMVTALHHTSDKLISQEKNGLIKIWDLGNKGYVEEHMMKTNYLGFCKCVISELDKFIIVPQTDSVVQAYDFDVKPIMKFSAEDPHAVGIVMCLKIINLPDGPYLLVAYESGDLNLWNFKSGQLVSNLKLAEYPIALDYDSTTNRGVYGTASNVINVFSVNRATKKLFIQCDITLKNDGINVMQIRQDRKVFATGGWDGRLRIFSWKSLRLLAVMNAHEGPINTLGYSLDKISLWSSQILAVGGNDGNISLWDLYN